MDTQAQNANTGANGNEQAAPETPKRKHICATAGYWFDAARHHRTNGSIADAFLCMENAYNHIENMLALGMHLTEQETPPLKHGWEHSEQVLVWYPAVENRLSERYSIAYYHYQPPFDGPQWVDFSGTAQGRTPERWWNLPLVSAAALPPGVAERVAERAAETRLSQRDEAHLTELECSIAESLKALDALRADVQQRRQEAADASKALSAFQDEVWGNLSTYSSKLGWGLTGIQPECWALLDAAVDELVKLRAEKQDYEAMRALFEMNPHLLARQLQEAEAEIVRLRAIPLTEAGVCADEAELERAGWVKSDVHKWRCPHTGEDMAFAQAFHRYRQSQPAVLSSTGTIAHGVAVWTSRDGVPVVASQCDRPVATFTAAAAVELEYQTKQACKE